MTKKPTITIPKGYVLETALEYVPGPGALEYMRELAEKFEADLLDIYEEIDSYLLNVDEKGIKRCQYCGYPFRDTTRNKSKLVCSDRCKRKKDIFLRKYKRSLNPNRRLSYRELHMTGHETGYTIWKSDYAMQNYDRNNKVDFYGKGLDEIEGRQQIRSMNGGRRKVTNFISYDGDEEYTPTRFEVKLPEVFKDLEPAPVTVKKRTKEEIDEYHLKTYGKRKLDTVRNHVTRTLATQRRKATAI